MNSCDPLSLFHVFGNNMVLQRDEPVTLSGRYAPGERVSAEIDARLAEAVTDANGVWRIRLEPHAAGGPFELRIQGNNTRISCKNVCFGDVFLCSGQSNMEMPVYDENPFYRLGDYEKLLADANDPLLRLYNANLVRQIAPEGSLDDLDGGGWESATAESVRRFSAVALLFGRQLRRDRPKIPIGLVNASWGGSRIEAWISQKKFQEMACEDELTALRTPGRPSPAKRRQREIFLRRMHAFLDRVALLGEPHRQELDAALCAKSAPPGFQPAVPPVRLTAPGVMVFRCETRLPETFTGRELRLSLGSMGDNDRLFWNGVEIGGTPPEVQGYWSGERNYLIPAHLVSHTETWIAFELVNHIGLGGWFGPEEKIRIAPVDAPDEGMALADWKCRFIYSAPTEITGIPPSPPEWESASPESPNFPSSLYNAMIHPWRRFRFRGVIWYQGCSNAGESTYFQHHLWLIDSWRELFQNSELPFFIVQLAGFYTCAPEFPPAADTWKGLPPEEEPTYAITREAQELLRFARKNIGLATAIDIGEQFDIHPRDKWTLGFRLARETERLIWGIPVESQGPEYRGCVREGDSIRVFFEHAAGLCTKDGGAPGAFAIGSKNGPLVWAEARIEGESVVVHSPEVAEPERVRYAFALYRGDINLMNGAGFPALPFRSDRPMTGS